MPEPNPFTARLAGPSNCWICWEPRFWPGPRGLWTAVATGRVALGDGEGRRLPEQVPALVDDVVLLPPIAPPGVAGRRALAGELSRRRVPFLVQVLAASPGATAGAGEGEGDEGGAGDDVAALVSLGGTALWDPLPLLLATADPERLRAAAEEAPRGAVAIWPLLAGLADLAALDAVCGGLRAAGVATVVPMRVEAEASARRQLTAAIAGERWDAVFHRQAPDEREILVRLRHHDLGWWTPRPLVPELAARRAANRQLASQLLIAAELAVRLGRPAGWAAELARLARRMERLPHDVRTLWLERNLGVLDFVGDTDVAQIEGWCREGRLPALAMLEGELDSEPVSRLGEAER